MNTIDDQMIPAPAFQPAPLDAQMQAELGIGFAPDYYGAQAYGPLAADPLLGDYPAQYYDPSYYGQFGAYGLAYPEGAYGLAYPPQEGGEIQDKAENDLRNLEVKINDTRE